MEHTLNAYKNAIVDWNNNRTNSETLLNYLVNGSCFQISREMYDNWNETEPDYIHAYLGVDTSSDSSSLGFMLIDSICDNDPETVTASNISYAPYLEGFDNLLDISPFSNQENPDNDITVLTGLQRSFRWMLNRKKYIENKVAEGGGENTGMFQTFRIPMSDLNTIFSDSEANNAIVVFGLKADNATADLILWSNHFQENQTVEDTALPMPPYGQGGYNLLTIALNP